LILLGIDPGSRNCGYGILEIEKRKIVSAGCGVIKIHPDLALEARLLTIYKEITMIIEEYKPALAAVETIFYGKNIRSSFILGHVRGVLLLALAEKNIKTYDFSPLEVKRAVVGNGNASKEQVLYMVQKIVTERVKIPSQDAADALAVAICTFHKQRYYL
jgi:crossover junction endodeoxyribonuclease RuvC